MYPLAAACSEVVTYDGLCRLCNRIVHHKYNGEEIANDTEGCYSVFAQMTDEYIIAQKHHAGYRSLTDECRGT